MALEEASPQAAPSAIAVVKRILPNTDGEEVGEDREEAKEAFLEEDAKLYVPFYLNVNPYLRYHVSLPSTYERAHPSILYGVAETTWTEPGQERLVDRQTQRFVHDRQAQMP